MTLKPFFPLHKCIGLWMHTRLKLQKIVRLSLKGFLEDSSKTLFLRKIQLFFFVWYFWSLFWHAVNNNLWTIFHSFSQMCSVRTFSSLTKKQMDFYLISTRPKRNDWRVSFSIFVFQIFACFCCCPMITYCGL